MRGTEQWLSEYGDSHRSAANKLLHWICVPVIVWCVVGLLWSLPVPQAWRTIPYANWAVLITLAAVLYYAVLSLPLALGALPVFLLMLWSVAVLARRAPPPLWSICAVAFVLAWIGQFIGHAIEGRRPSFFKDLQFLMIGPLWLLAAAYRRLGIRY
ncbi:MAG: Mpo1-like protein [Steroidobacteraceae bacterium]|jgi:uncharacterized membrane protein YGL010W